MLRLSATSVTRTTAASTLISRLTRSNRLPCVRLMPGMANSSVMMSDPTSSNDDISSNSQFTPLHQLRNFSSGAKGYKIVLKEKFIHKYQSRKPPFGFNGLGEFVYRRTYARRKHDGTNEEWWETVRRVVEGTFSLQYKWAMERRLGWNHPQAQKRAEDMYARIFDMKFLPPGRGLWAMGSPLTEERRLYAALNNCAFVSTGSLLDKTSDSKKSAPFTFLMDAAMLGVGVGFDTKGGEAPGGKGNKGVKVRGINKKREHTMVIEDSREGWVESVGNLIDAYFDGAPDINFDYSRIRLAGTPIKGFGGVASGPESLRELHDSLREILEANTGCYLTVTAIVDMMNVIGRCVVSGNVRRTAEIAFGDPDNEEYVDLKNYEVNPHRQSYGWASNNSVFATPGMDYGPVCERVRRNGEPGFAWLENMRAYSRMGDLPDNKDKRAEGGNPCLEQTLESYELCCLVETFPNNHDSLEDYLCTLEAAYLYAKTVTLGETHWPESNRVMLRNRRIGCSVSGVTQFISSHGLNTLKHWLTSGYSKISEYDEKFSEEFAVPRSIKMTSVKPSGTVSLLAGATPGMHYPHSRFQLRRVRLAAESELLGPLQAAGYHIEDDVYAPNTKVVSFPVDIGPNMRSVSEVTMWEQLLLASFLQRYWADNQVSCTVTFDPEIEGPQLRYALDHFQYMLKGVSFLPRTEEGAYAQMPYEAINEEQYKKMIETLSLVDFSNVSNHIIPDRFCDSDACELPIAVGASSVQAPEKVVEAACEEAMDAETRRT